MKKTLREYQKAISKAESKEELNAISYDALKNDPECTVFSKKYDRIIDMCVRREEKLSRSEHGPEKKPPLSERLMAAEKVKNQKETLPAPHTLEAGR